MLIQFTVLLKYWSWQNLLNCLSIPMLVKDRTQVPEAVHLIKEPNMGSKESQHTSLFLQYAKITAVVATYWVVSIAMVFANKSLLSGQNLSAPFFITGFQCVVTVAICFVSSVIPQNVIKVPQVSIKLSTLLQVLPLSAVFVGMITFNNLCLQNVHVSFYYIGRSLTTVFNVISTYTILGQKTSVPSLVCCSIIIFGFLLGVDQEKIAGSLSLSGVIYGVLASLFVSLFAIYTKKILPVVDGSIWHLSYLNNINASCLFLPLTIVFGEWKVISEFTGLYDPGFWVLMCFAGVFGFAIGYVTGLQIQVTSPLTHNISGTAKACAQTVLGSWWYVESKSILWWFSNMVVLFGSAAYTRVKQVEMAANHKVNAAKISAQC